MKLSRENADAIKRMAERNRWYCIANTPSMTARAWEVRIPNRLLPDWVINRLTEYVELQDFFKATSERGATMYRHLIEAAYDMTDNPDVRYALEDWQILERNRDKWAHLTPEEIIKDIEKEVNR